MVTRKVPPYAVRKALRARTLAVGRRRPKTPPPSAPEKRIPISIRVAPATLEAFRATGPGWQIRMNEVLDKAAATLAALEV